MANLFQVKVPTINGHLKRLYAEGEIQPEATIRQFLIVRQEGARQVNRSVEHYNLDAILSVGYRIAVTRLAISPAGQAVGYFISSEKP